MPRPKLIFATVVSVLVMIGIGIGIHGTRGEAKVLSFWQQAVSPGKLSQSHLFLANSCSACHTPVKGVEPALCISCHADNTELLQRQPTAFHANIQVCSGCHLEHQGMARMPTTMDHALLSKTAHRELRVSLGGGPADSRLSAKDMETVVKMLDRVPAAQPPVPDTPGASAQANGCASTGDCTPATVANQPTSGSALPVNHPRSGPAESMLNCVSCHATKDRHQGLLGSNCVQCHATDQWKVVDFRHPSVRSTECAQCHRPPPSHNMMHFSMMSAPMARQPNAKVHQCYLCHQSTSWNDIKGLGRLDHH